MDDLAIVCDKVIDAEGKSYDEIKTIPTNFNEKEAICKTQNFYIWLASLLITTALFIAASIYCYLVKYWAKRKHLLSFRVRNNKLKQVLYWLI